MDVRPDDLLAFAIREAVEQAEGLDPNDIVDVMVGCGFPQEKQGMNLARRAALLAGLPKRVPGTTVNRFCASSLQTARMAFHAIKAGEGDVYVAAGVESISQVDGYPKDSEELHPKLVGEGAIANVYIPMGLTAENVAERYDVSRDDMDRYAQRSQERAVAAQESGFFARELTPYTKEDGTVVSADDGPRPSSTYEKLQELQPAFVPEGKVTAGNSCPLNDGAAALVIMSDERAAEIGLKPRARIIASSVTGLDPEIMGVGPIDAVKVALGRAGMTIDDVDVMELNEAFAAQVLPVCRELGVDPFGEKLNPHGGAIALGHPYGMTGARIMCTLLNDLDTIDGTIGLETMCVGGGQGMAMVVERLSCRCGATQSRATRRGCALEGKSSIGEPFADSRCTPFAAPAGDGAVLKVVPARHWESDHEADALAHWGGDGAARLLRHDRARRAFLIERARPGNDISGLPDAEATAIAVDVGSRLWRPAGAPSAASADELPRWIEDAEGDARAQAEELLRRLELRHDVLVHGDFHHHNVLASARGPLRDRPASRCSASPSTTSSPFLWNPLPFGLGRSCSARGSPRSPRPGSTRSASAPGW